MIDREKVIKGLECCILSDEECECLDECPYHDDCWETDCELGYILKKDALKLLKEQEPRVLTLEEVIKHYSLPPVVLDDLEWQEDYLQDIKPLYFDFPTKDSFAVHWRGYQQVRQYLEDWKASYGQTWRCWTAKPTNEQREALKWDE